ncbi:hypothetical protein FACS1894140_0170 [Spirochaetia bacterium]|nr:hypothetical protein FACS1894140_0170 [Spirochaetia bacterium]
MRELRARALPELAPESVQPLWVQVPVFPLLRELRVRLVSPRLSELAQGRAAPPPPGLARE